MAWWGSSLNADFTYLYIDLIRKVVHVSCLILKHFHVAISKDQQLWLSGLFQQLSGNLLSFYHPPCCSFMTDWYVRIFPNQDLFNSWKCTGLFSKFSIFPVMQIGKSVSILVSMMLSSGIYQPVSHYRKSSRFQDVLQFRDSTTTNEIF